MPKGSSSKPAGSLQVHWLKAALTVTMRENVRPEVLEKVAANDSVHKDVQRAVESSITGRLREHRTMRLEKPKGPEADLIAQWIGNAIPANLQKGLKPEFLATVQQDIGLHEEIRSIAMREVESQLTRG